MFKRVVIVGTGKIALSCLKLVLQYFTLDKVLVFEYCPSNLSTLKRSAQKQGVVYFSTTRKECLTEQLLQISDNTLVISANNLYLFPKKICDMPNLIIINYHSALLPEYAGMNAITWTIFYNEKIGGITWHRVDSQIDHGEVLIQEKCEIKDNITALQLNRIYDRLATEAFAEIFPLLMNGKLKGEEQAKGNYRIYKSYEIPEHGKIDFTKDNQYLYRFLRSIDFGRAQLFPYPEVEFENELLQVVGYSFENVLGLEEKVVKTQNQIERCDSKGVLRMETRKRVETA